MKLAWVHNAGALYRWALIRRLGPFAFRTTASQGLSVLLQDELQCTSPMTFKMVPLGTVLNRKISLLFLPVSQPQLRHISDKTQSLKSPCETSVFTHKHPACGYPEVLERMNGRCTGPSLKINRNRKEHNAVTYFLKFWNFASLQRWSVGYAGPPLT